MSMLLRRLLTSPCQCHTSTNIYRYYSSGSFGYDSLKNLNLRKKLLTTLLFGGTFLAALWAKKRRKLPKAFEEATLLPKNEFYNSNLKLYNYRGFVLPDFVLKTVDSVTQFECREDDIFVASFPKTGTTWLQEIIYSIVHGVYPDGTTSKSIEDKFPYLEFVYPGLKSITKISGQRFIKTHLPYSLLPTDITLKKPKIFYIVRNPKDVMVSYYHFLRMLTISNYVGSFTEFVKDMVADRVPYGPMWKHYLDMWSHKDEPNIMLLSYEDLHKDIHGTIKKISDFLGKSLTESEIEQIARHCSFSEMASNPDVNYSYWDDLGFRNKSEAKFMRKGEVGDWKNYVNPELNDKIDSWIGQYLGREMSFIYELDNSVHLQDVQ